MNESPLASPETALRQILDAVGVDRGSADTLRMEGGDPALPTRFLMGTAGAAALAALGLAAADLWRLRGGGGQQISIDTRRGAAALRTTRYLRVNGGEAPEYWDPISGFYQGRDGRSIQLHCHFPHFRDGVLELLQCGHDRGAVARAISGWSTAELEDALAARGLPAFMVRDNAEWVDHPQGHAVAGLPLMEIERIGDAPPCPMPEGGRPLAGIRVLDLTRVIAGPVSGRTLAEHGADVLRVSGPARPFIEPLVIDTGHGKRAAEIDLDAASGRRTLESLIANADVFSQSYRPGSLEQRGFGPAAVTALRPGIVYVTLSAWGHVGPWAMRRGYDSLVQCASGIADEHGRDGQPAHLPGQALDYLSGYIGAFGAMVALARRAREGGSWRVRLSLAQTAHWLKSLGRVDTPDDPRDQPDPGAGAIGEWLAQSSTAWGRLTHLGPVLGMSETPPGWDLPVRPLASDAPVWQ